MAPTATRALAAALLWSAACSPESTPEPPLGSPAEELQRRIEDLYRQARDSGDDVPGDAYEWARSDLDKIGDWEYRVIRLADAGDDDLERRLDELGGERWEVFWLEPDPSGAGGYRAFLKRPARSLLRHVPLSELRRLVPAE